MSTATTAKARRRTPTQKQIDSLKDLRLEELLPRAVEALHALNRRAKEKRDRASEYRRASFAEKVRDEMEVIYRQKDHFLDAALRAGMAKLFTFEVQTGTEYDCCGRTWYSSAEYDESECFSCGCAVYGDPSYKTWYVVEVCGRRFHQPSIAADVEGLAEPTEAHDPRQPQREVPNVGLTIEAQSKCVEMATDALRLRPLSGRERVAA